MTNSRIADLLIKRLPPKVFYEHTIHIDVILTKIHNFSEILYFDIHTFINILFSYFMYKLIYDHSHYEYG